MGACIRNERGDFVAVFSSFRDGIFTPADAEAWGLLQGLEWLATLGYSKVIIEMDCKMVVNDVKHYKPM
ncbi:ribonuclease H protein [Trifolium medium]|uniref:Ribonuclease H protein n=1 Tax=Trifolium medium TaxID=97028 RepID=A0A392MUN5_9FABA|nr:ribonuclease H protein [Trifolium medium]